jgi:hypothetical protein
MNRPMTSPILMLLGLALLNLHTVARAQLPLTDSESTDWDLQAETDRIAADVADIRELPLKDHVVAERQSKDSLAEHVRKGLRRQLGDDMGHYYIEALVRLGALKEPVDLAQTIIDLASSQAAAHYDPEANKFFLLMTNMPLSMLSITASHELCHALQDQHFDLTQFMESDLEALRNNQDASLARQCLVEGDATDVMTGWMVKTLAGTTNPATIALTTSTMIALQANMGYETMCTLGAEQAEKSGMDFLSSSIKDLDKLPRFFVEPLFESYFKGARLIEFMKGTGGWSAVNDLYQHPPLSSEQVLHPEKLSEPRENPVAVSLPTTLASLGSGWVEKERDVMGELGIAVFLKVWLNPSILDDNAASSAAAGWGGDEYVYMEHESSHTDCLIWKTLWDSEQDANEFALNWRLSLSERFPNMKAIPTKPSNTSIPTQSWEVSPGRYIQLARKGLFVGIQDTTDPLTLASIVWQ